MSACTVCDAEPAVLELGPDRGSFCEQHARRVKVALERGMRAAYPMPPPIVPLGPRDRWRATNVQPMLPGFE